MRHLIATETVRAGPERASIELVYFNGWPFCNSIELNNVPNTLKIYSVIAHQVHAGPGSCAKRDIKPFQILRIHPLYGIYVSLLISRIKLINKAHVQNVCS